MNTLLLCPELFASEGGIPRILRLYLRALCEEAAPDGAVDLAVLNDTSIPAAACERYANARLRHRVASRRSKACFALAALRLGKKSD
ncbi:MAG: hypothetical protein KGJ37_07770, partial [Verrucomicrobiota bacterium]|nr:hypothetical protein [Verrucomicrobiota bacterium]